MSSADESEMLVFLLKSLFHYIIGFRVTTSDHFQETPEFKIAKRRTIKEQTITVEDYEYSTHAICTYAITADVLLGYGSATLTVTEQVYTSQESILDTQWGGTGTTQYPIIVREQSTLTPDGKTCN